MGIFGSCKFQRTSLFTILLLLLILLTPFHPLLAGDPFEEKRQTMVERDLKRRGIKDPRVLEAMGRVFRHLFVGESQREQAYGDYPLPIAEGQTISQPYVVALMTEAVTLKPTDRVLEIGTGSGYQAAVLAEIVKEVYTIEIRKPLAETASKRLTQLGYKNVRTKYGDGYFGWEEVAPFDAILITAATNHIPPPLLQQLNEGGRLILPLGSTTFHQTLTLITKEKGELRVQEMGGVIFVPLVGEGEKKR
ncbi:MAG: protein-L-isoaspartate(D-aspartate) O-methyltransferase [Desulfobacterales bacterium]|nr:protein-L-isoaspartate(D-aspartate) O-methyltransferase [Desulfobacterales bacterium]